MVVWIQVCWLFIFSTLCLMFVTMAGTFSDLSTFLKFRFRLFSCGTSKDGESFLVEWNESEGAIKRSYSGFRKKSVGSVQFDTTQNHFLAVGEDNQIKFWDMDNTNMLTSTDADGGLPVSIQFFSCNFTINQPIRTGSNTR